MNKIILFVLAGLVIIGGGLFYLYSYKTGLVKITPKVEVIKLVSVTPGTKVGIDQGIRNGTQLAFEQKNYQAGRYKLQLTFEDDGDDAGNWTADREKNIATRAVNDPDVMAYLGPNNSGAAGISIPITNKAGLVQISPGNTWPGLTQAGFAPGEPGIYYPAGIRNYFRVVPTDALQGPAGAVWAHELGVKTIIILDDGDTYGKGIADLFERKAVDLGIKVVARKTININAKDPIADLKIENLKADLVYFGGVTSNGAVPIAKSVKRLGMAPKFMGPDGFAEQAFIDQAGDAAEGVYTTTVGIPTDQLTGKGKTYVEQYRARYGIEPDSYSVFGYEMANVIILAIERAGVKDRAKILNEVSKIRDYDGLLGTWSFDANGDTTLDLITGNMVVNKRFEFQKILPANR